MTSAKQADWQEGKPDSVGVFETATDEEIKQGYKVFFYQHWNGEFWMGSALTPSHAMKKSKSGCQDVKYRKVDK